VLQKAQQHANVHFRYGKINSSGNESGLGYVLTDGEKLYAAYVFNSIAPSLPQAYQNQLNLPSSRHSHTSSLLQHFKGWLIETPENIFDDTAATFMDFRVSQQKATTFVYVLPVATNKALVEFTLVSDSLLNQTDYDQGLTEYISNYVTNSPYTVLEEEFGIIPMTDFRFPTGTGQVINIGTAGGQTKASSGFTFQFIQKHSAAMVQLLADGKHPLVQTPLLQNRFHLYDSILLYILKTGKMQGANIFARMFKKIRPKTILRFLDNESRLLEELRIMAGMPARIFLPVAARKITLLKR
jgi:lycopene beta-cyclase